MRVSATRCDDKCVNTIVLETQGPCGSVRKCGADTVTDETSAHVKMSQEVRQLLQHQGWAATVKVGL